MFLSTLQVAYKAQKLLRCDISHLVDVTFLSMMTHGGFGLGCHGNGKWHIDVSLSHGVKPSISSKTFSEIESAEKLALTEYSHWQRS